MNRKTDWKVFYQGDPRRHVHRDHRGKEFSLHREFTWGEETWFLPALYLCGQGIVLDMFLRAEPEKERAFRKKFGLDENNDGTDLSEEVRLAAEAEDPLGAAFKPALRLNGKQICGAWGTGMYFRPGLEAESSMKETLTHYKLDIRYGWAFHRWRFPVPGVRQKELRSLELLLKREKTAMPGPVFDLSAPGARAVFTDPWGQTHTLQAVCMEPQRLEERHFPGMENREMPRYFTLMQYVLEPDLDSDRYALTDAKDGDRPRPGNTGKKGAGGAAAIGIIGGADGPVTVFLAGGSSRKKTACSSLRFEPSEFHSWRITFYEKKLPDITVKLF